MKFTATIALALAAGAASAAPAEPRRLCPDPASGAFYLSAVPSAAGDGAPMPLGVATVSRGAKSLGTMQDWTDQFTYNRTSHRFQRAGPDTEGPNNAIQPRYPVTFGPDPMDPDAADPGQAAQLDLHLDPDSCQTFLVKAGTTDALQWSASPSQGQGLPGIVTYYGPADPSSNVLLRLDEAKPQQA